MMKIYITIKQNVLRVQTSLIFFFTNHPQLYNWLGLEIKGNKLIEKKNTGNHLSNTQIQIYSPWQIIN